MKSSVVISIVFLDIVNAIKYVNKKEKSKVLRVKLPVWKPKTNGYNPRSVDWSGVISGCKAACRYEKRFCNFYIRAAAHDSLSVSEGYGGADGSLMLTEDEIRRSENNYDSFTYLLSKNVIALAQKYDASVADIIAVCGAVATEFLGGPKIIKYDKVQPFVVGRHDSIIPNPANALAPANMNTSDFSNFAKYRNLTIEEMTALMGTHSLLDEKGCLMKDGSYCNPNTSDCSKTEMFTWSNTYYKETCTPKIRVNVPSVKSNLPLPTVEFLQNHDKCKFTSPELKQKAIDLLNVELGGVLDPKALVTGIDTEFEDISWYNGTTNIVYKKWQYTIHDAWMGKACQKDLPQTDYNIKIGNSMNTFKNNQNTWETTYIRAYKKMVNTRAIWCAYGPYAITGDECHSGYVSSLPNVNCKLCKVNCPSSCRCKTAFNETEKFYF